MQLMHMVYVLGCRHPSYFVGLLLRGAALPYTNFGHVVLAKPSPILFYPISSTEVPCQAPAVTEQCCHAHVHSCAAAALNLCT
jgi:hypothetical protein